MKLSVLFILSVLTVMQACEGKVSVKPGFTKKLLDVIGNWLGIGQTNMGDFYQWSHQCNWPLIKNIVLNCPTSSPSSDVELDPKSDTQAEAALEKFSVENWDRATVAKMTFQQRSDLFKPCFDNEHNFLLCTQRSWTILGMDMCEVWHHANQYATFCGDNACYCMNHVCTAERIRVYNSAVNAEYQIDQHSRLPGQDWEPATIETVQKEWCDNNSA